MNSIEQSETPNRRSPASGGSAIPTTQPCGTCARWKPSSHNPHNHGECAIGGLVCSWWTGCVAHLPNDRTEPTESAVRSSDLLGVEACGLHKRTPYGMTNVSMTQLSIARHYGGCRFQGEDYIYLPTTDELIRHDVLRWQRKQKRAAKTANDQAHLPPGSGGGAQKKQSK